MTLATQTRSVSFLRQSITIEAGKAIGFKPDSWQQKLFGALFWLPAHRFASLCAEFDFQIEQNGVTQAMRWVLPRFASQVSVSGAENIPQGGPLLVVSNHPGAFDGVVILAQFKRDDIKFIVSDVPFLRGVPAAEPHMIYSDWGSIHGRMNAVRQSIRHLQGGGVLVIYPTGLVDPDPSFMTGAEQALEDWSHSLELFLRKAPNTQVLPTIVSGIIAPRFLNNFLARRQSTVRNRQKVAEYMEMVQLMVIQKNLNLTPRVSFGKPLMLADLGGIDQPSEWLGRLIQSTRQLLVEHVAENYS
ncbi:MAG: hypothetical protein H6Q37_1594 [Chloroflexi bacterium]|jgi:hypothetical protein|nr:hypothetical protein [Chloroflexota bacterium]